MQSCKESKTSASFSIKKAPKNGNDKGQVKAIVNRTDIKEEIYITSMTSLNSSTLNLSKNIN